MGRLYILVICFIIWANMYFYAKSGELDVVTPPAFKKAKFRLGTLGLWLKEPETFEEFLPRLGEVAEDLRTVALYKNKGSVQDIGDDYAPGTISAMNIWGSAEARAGQLLVGIDEDAIALRAIAKPMTDPLELSKRVTWDVRLPLGQALLGSFEDIAGVAEVRHSNYAQSGQVDICSAASHLEGNEALTTRTFQKGIMLASRSLLGLQSQPGV
jgi:hypothetical protein